MRRGAPKIVELIRPRQSIGRGITHSASGLELLKRVGHDYGMVIRFRRRSCGGLWV